MTDAEKVKILTEALHSINKTIYARGAPLGSNEYFSIRTTAVDALKETEDAEP